MNEQEREEVYERFREHYMDKYIKLIESEGTNALEKFFINRILNDLDTLFNVEVMHYNQMDELRAEIKKLKRLKSVSGTNKVIRDYKKQIKKLEQDNRTITFYNNNFADDNQQLKKLLKKIKEEIRYLKPTSCSKCSKAFSEYCKPDNSYCKIIVNPKCQEILDLIKEYEDNCAYAS